MKKTFSIIVKICSFLILILSLVMMFIEGRIIVSLEWTVYDSFFNGLFRYLHIIKSIAILSSIGAKSGFE